MKSKTLSVKEAKKKLGLDKPKTTLPSLRSSRNLTNITCPCCKHSVSFGYIIHKEYDLYKKGPRKGEIKRDRWADPKIVIRREELEVKEGDEFIEVILSNNLIRLSFVGMNTKDDYYYKLLVCPKCKTVFASED